jgi:ubiquinone/menaquinone biosynthesis C-methylase UbiE
MKEETEEIIEYYKINWLNRIANLDKNISPNFHYGIIKKNSSDLDAKEELNRLLFQKVESRRPTRILDAGCGIGATASFLTKKLKKAEVYAVNIDPAQIALGKKRYKSKRIKWCTADYSDLPFEKGFFDIVFGIESICHTKKKARFFKEASRILKKGGLLVIFDNFITKKLSDSEKNLVNKVQKGWHTSLFNEKELPRITKQAGLKLVELTNLSEKIIKDMERSSKIAKKKKASNTRDVETSHLDAVISIYELVKRRVVGYKLLVAEKLL